MQAKHLFRTTLFLTCMAIGVSSTSPMLAQAQSITQESPSKCQNNLITNFGTTNDAQSVRLAGKAVKLYCEFDNPTSALNSLRMLKSEDLTMLASQYNLEPLSENNWKEYQEAAILEGNMAIMAFFDIYENTEKNDQIIALAATQERKIGASSLDEIALLLPYTEQVLSTTSSANEMSLLHASLPNVSAAVAYAEQYAWTPNTAQYQNFGSVDCTNFASQILEASGVPQEVYSSEFLGWWHQKNGNTHTHSVSWINSDTFARYMGVGYTTSRILNLSMNIGVGDFLALDNTSDGDWDHVGFVTYKNNTPGTYGDANLTYYDFIIAQHSSNYNMWVSEEGNSWEKYSWEYGGIGTYGRVRR